MKLSLYTKARLLFRLERDPYLRFFYSLLGFCPKDIALYRLALRHRSKLYAGDAGIIKNSCIKDNERLEFLGDAVLEAAITDILYHHFPDQREGFLTSTRAKIVQRDTMNRIAVEMGLDHFISAARNISKQGSNIYGNALEAVIGAIYLDRGYKRAKRFVREKIIKPYLNLNDIAGEEINFKSHLIEWGQKYKIGVTFSTDELPGRSAHNPKFRTEVIIGSDVVSLGMGSSKKESQQKAAEVALEKIRSFNSRSKFLAFFNRQEGND